MKFRDTIGLALLALLTGASPLVGQDGVPDAAPLVGDSAVSPVFVQQPRPEPPLSPGGAFFRSLLIPGWGQAELGAESRGAFYFFAETASLLMLIRTQIRLDHAERTLPEDDPVVDARKQQREDWIALTVFLAFFNAADAWVSVHLWGFEEVTQQGGEVSLDLGWEIPVGP